MLNGSQHTAEPSVAALLGGIVNDAKDLLVQELALITLEVHDTLRKAKTAAIALGLGLAVVAIGGILLMLMLVQVLAAYTEIPLWGCYGIVGGVLVVLGGVLLAAGKRQAEAIDVVPQRTLKTMKENAQWLTWQTTCNRTSTMPVTRSRTPVRP
jgi:Putative Actinobacterial Holin-X, holin superfamily III